MAYSGWGGVELRLGCAAHLWIVGGGWVGGLRVDWVEWFCVSGSVWHVGNNLS